MAHNIWSRFIHSDNDLTGLVAYSLYKQEKIDWVARRAQFLPRLVSGGRHYFCLRTCKID